MVKEQENHQLIKSFNKISINTAILDEIEQIDFDDDVFIDLANFERKEIISKSDFMKFYKLNEINTKKTFSGQFSMSKLSIKINKQDLEDLSSELKN